MKNLTRTSRRLGAAGLALGLGLGLISVAGPAAADQSAADTSSQWLSSQLVDGKFENPLNPAMPDYGLMEDAVLQMVAAGRSDLAEEIGDVLDEEVGRYFAFADSDFESLGWRTAGAAAKTLMTAEALDRRDAQGRFSLDGYDLVTEVKNTLPTVEQFSDPNTFLTNPGMVYNSYPDEFGPYWELANMFGQSLAIIGLAGGDALDDVYDAATGQTYGQALTDGLLHQQCSAGFFVIFPHFQGLSCDEALANGEAAPDGDATAMSLSALLAARDAGVTGLDDDIDRTVDWIVDAQDASGGWGGGVSTEAPNTNSTGLLVQALAEAGGPADVIADGRAYLASSQVTLERDGEGGLAPHVGAIAYNPAEYGQAQQAGAGPGGSDRWIRATAQAALGLSDVGFSEIVKGPLAPRVELTGPGSVVSGTSATFTVAASGGTGEIVVERRVDEGQWTAVEDGSFTLSGLSVGVHTVEARATDENDKVGTDSVTLTVTSAPQPTEFTDTAGNTFSSEIAWLSTQGITTGYDNGNGTVSFRPSGAVLREQMAAFLYRYDHDGSNPPGDAPSATFTDSVNNTFSKHIAWLAAEGISTGYSDNTFRPSAPVLREQMAAFLYRLAGSPDVELPATSPFADIPTSHTFYKEIVWLARTEITTGYSEGGVTTFRGSQPVLREQMAAFLFRFNNLP